jgi:hypothetical protein
VIFVQTVSSSSARDSLVPTLTSEFLSLLSQGYYLEGPAPATLSNGGRRRTHFPTSAYPKGLYLWLPNSSFAYRNTEGRARRKAEGNLLKALRSVLQLLYRGNKFD